MMFVYSCILYSALYITRITAQTCATGQDNGPCLNGACAPGATCLMDLDVCCNDAGVIAASTLVSSATDTTFTGTGSTVSGASTVSSATSGSTVAPCVDKLNPRTGVSDCPMRAGLCNDANYYAVMTEQCPRTCGRCSSGTTSSTCVDKINAATGVSDCPALAHLCSNSAYTTLMTEQCPRTCNRCSSSGVSSATTIATSCVDKVNPRTGTSDCPMRASLCQDSNYIAIMRTECPRTCGFCSTTGVTGATVTGTITGATVTTPIAGICVDVINPRTGVSDCPQRVDLCTDSVYRNLMQTQCPKTCGVC